MSNQQNKRSQRAGQGLIEYLIIVAIMAVASLGIIRVLGQTVASRFASATFALQGKKKAVHMEEVNESLYKKKDLGTFINGAAKNDDQQSE